jgi:hypothetical protein
MYLGVAIFWNELVRWFRYFSYNRSSGLWVSCRHSRAFCSVAGNFGRDAFRKDGVLLYSVYYEVKSPRRFSIASIFGFCGLRRGILSKETPTP